MDRSRVLVLVVVALMRVELRDALLMW
jgi:hypothetical protein